MFQCRHRADGIDDLLDRRAGGVPLENGGVDETETFLVREHSLRHEQGVLGNQRTQPAVGMPHPGKRGLLVDGHAHQRGFGHIFAQAKHRRFRRQKFRQARQGRRGITQNQQIILPLAVGAT